MNKTALKAILAASLTVTAFGATAAVTQLTSPADITTTYVNDFETDISSGPATFDNTAFRITASMASDYVTSSGTYGLFEYVDDGPLNVHLSSKYNAVGFYFGNDDFGYAFDVILSVFDGATNLGSVTLAVNKNDHADQFIGLSSSLAFDRVQIDYQRPEAHSLGVFIDDFRLGAPVPEPSTYALMLAGLGIVAAAGGLRQKR